MSFAVGKSTDVTENYSVDIQGLGVNIPGMIGQGLNGQHWLLARMGSPTLLIWMWRVRYMDLLTCENHKALTLIVS